MDANERYAADALLRGHSAAVDRLLDGGILGERPRPGARTTPAAPNALPFGLPALSIKSDGKKVELLARATVRVRLVGFVCLTDGLVIEDLRVSKNPLCSLSTVGFASEGAALPGIRFAPHQVEISQDVIAVVSGLRGIGTHAREVKVRAYFLAVPFGAGGAG